MWHLPQLSARCYIRTQVVLYVGRTAHGWWLAPLPLHRHRHCAPRVCSLIMHHSCTIALHPHPLCGCGRWGSAGISIRHMLLGLGPTYVVVVVSHEFEYNLY
jgi:hypothetical protein